MSQNCVQQDNVDSSANTLFEACNMPMCGMRFRSKLGLRTHQMDHVLPGTRYGCFHCGKWFMILGDLMVHLMTHGADKLYSCSACDDGFSSFIAARTHVQTHVEDEADAAKIQSRTNTGEVLYTCSICGQELDMMSTFCSHMEKHDIEFKEKVREPLKTLHESQTGKDADSRNKEAENRGKKMKADKMNAVQFSHIPEVDNPEQTPEDGRKCPGKELHMCKECGKIYDSSTVFHTHIKNHKDETKYPCSLCGDTFSTLSKRNSHLRTHLGDMVFRCTKCGMLLRDKSQLDIHMGTHDEPSVPYAEPNKILPKALNAEKNISMDVNETESNALNVKGEEYVENALTQSNTLHKCHVCTNEFDNISTLDLHLKSHYGNMPHSNSSREIEYDVQESNDADHENDTVSKSVAVETCTEEPCDERETEMEPDEGPHICVLCGAEFETWTAVNAHLKAHNLDKSHTCPQCNKGFQHELHLKVHMLSHKEELLQGKRKKSPRKSKALICPAILRRRATVNTKENVPSNLEEHATTHGELGDSDLENGEESEQSSSQNEHIEGVDDVVVTTDKHVCSLCGRGFHNSWNLYQHVKKHTGGAHTCSVCSTEFQHLWHLHQHMVAHTAKPVQCTVCSAEFRERGDLQIHMRTHKPKKCPICCKEFQYPASLVKHMDVHKRKPHSCSGCGKVFKYAANLRQHMVVHEDAPAPAPHKCYICSKEFKLLANLAEHNMLDHPVPRTNTPHECGFCGKGFTQATAFIEHTLEHATVAGQSTYKCPYCSRTFMLLSSVKQHITNHIQLHCPHCAARFRVSSNFYKHVAAHTCWCCGVLFPKLSDLKEHLSKAKKEQEQNILMCPVCNRGCENCICIQCHPSDQPTYKYAACDTCVEGFLLLSDLENHLETHVQHCK